VSETGQTRLAVWLDGAPAPVGTLIGLSSGGFATSFVYDGTYLDRPGAVPLSASLPLRPTPYGDAEARAFFDNLLPEGERRRTEALARRLDPADVVGLLAVLGADCPGAVSVLPEAAASVKVPGRLREDYELLDEARLAALVTDVAAGRSVATRTRFSVAGVQRKLALARDPAKGTFLLSIAGAPTTHILKVEPRDGEHRGIVANEALCLDVFRRLGLPVVHAERTVIAGIQVLTVTRYDRHIHDGLVTRRHQEDAAQALGVPRELKYEDDAEKAELGADQRGLSALLGRFAALTRGPGDARLQLLRATHANWLLGNADAHLKNFALLHDEARFGHFAAGQALGFGFDLAPFYDVVCTGAYPGVDQTFAMRIGRADQWGAVEREDWLRLAAQMFPGRRVGAAVLARQLDWLRTMAMAVLPAIDAAVADGVTTRIEAKPIRDVAGSRLRHLNRTLGWNIPADTDAPVHRGGGWTLS
jgi:serine/threonine-protein kinase HipA